MSNIIDPAFWLFLALGWGFALITILMSWWRVDHGLGQVLAARREYKRVADEVDALKDAPANLRSEWPAIYIGLRKVALENNANGKERMQLYRHVVQRHSRPRDIEMILPEMNLPPELESPEPPPLPQVEAPEDETEEKETRQ